MLNFQKMKNDIDEGIYLVYNTGTRANFKNLIAVFKDCIIDILSKGTDSSIDLTEDLAEDQKLDLVNIEEFRDFNNMAFLKITESDDRIKIIENMLK